MDNSFAEETLELFAVVSDEIGKKLKSLESYNLTRKKPGQYNFDIIADQVAIPILEKLGVSILSEESGLIIDKGFPAVMIDPIDGSSNFARKIGPYATSLVLTNQTEPLVAYVKNHFTEDVFSAVSNKGSYLNAKRLEVKKISNLSQSFIALSGYPPNYMGWRQFRALGAAAVEISSVATGQFDAFIDCSLNGLGVWDYLAAALILTEAGGKVSEMLAQDLITLDPLARRHIVCASSQELLSYLSDQASSLKLKKILHSLKSDLINIANKNLSLRSASLYGLSQLSEQSLDYLTSTVHFTGSALIVNNNRVLLHKHKVLNKWVQPGGHLENLEAPWEAAVREASEETGLSVTHVPGGPKLIWVEIRYGIKDHIHIDLTYQCQAPFLKPKPPIDESQEVAWFNFAEVSALADNQILDLIRASKMVK